MLAKHVARLCAFIVLGFGSAVWADHIPGHDPLDPTFPVPLPGPQFFNGGVLFGTFIGPVEGTQILNTTYDITYVSDGTTPAANLLIEMSVMVNNDVVELVVTGADLGFGSGAGTFDGTFQTNAFNGTVWQPAIFPHSIIDLNIGATTGGIEGSGFFQNSFIVFDVIPVPEPASIMLLLGGAVIGRRARR